MAPTIDDKPYIIVDNHKIHPIERSPQSSSATADRSGREDQPFGVVDRVTISREARERSKRAFDTTRAIPKAITEDHPRKQPGSASPVIGPAGRQRS